MKLKYYNETIKNKKQSYIKLKKTLVCCFSAHIYKK